ncbi:MAG: hypothetical protein H6R05_1100 [Burkholderiaceae bacterium]|nr:hypothetical protein [Burkholderiaceae bacterium]
MVIASAARQSTIRQINTTLADGLLRALAMTNQWWAKYSILFFCLARATGSNSNLQLRKSPFRRYHGFHHVFFGVCRRHKPCFKR